MAWLIVFIRICNVHRIITTKILQRLTVGRYMTMKMLRKFLQSNRNQMLELHNLIIPGEDHVDPDDSLVRVGVVVRHLLPLVDDVLAEVLGTLVNQVHGIELSEDVVRSRDVVVKAAVLQRWRSVRWRQRAV